MTNVSATADRASAGDAIPPRCSLIEVHVGELKQLFDAIDPRHFARGTWIRKRKSSSWAGPRNCPNTPSLV